MTDDEIRIEIAEACGWRRWCSATKCYLTNPRDKQTEQFWLECGDFISEKQPVDKIDGRVPDYLKDLNAMHEAEKILGDAKDDEYSKICEYNEQLCLVCGDGVEPLNVYEVDLIRATARQRAEAFLRTLGKWRDG